MLSQDAASARPGAVALVPVVDVASVTWRDVVSLRTGRTAAATVKHAALLTIEVAVGVAMATSRISDRYSWSSNHLRIRYHHFGDGNRGYQRAWSSNAYQTVFHRKRFLDQERLRSSHSNQKRAMKIFTEMSDVEFKDRAHRQVT